MEDFEDAFREIQDKETLSHFENLSKISRAMTDEQRARYGETNPIRIMFVAGISEEYAIAYSAN